MLTDNLLQGYLVRLTTLVAADFPAMARWYNDAGFMRLYDARPAYPKSEETLREEWQEGRKKGDAFLFAVRAVVGDQLLGYVEIDGILWTHRVAWISLCIGERLNWGKGYGGDALRLALGYAFDELNLHRVQLTVFGYNLRAVALYEKFGFQREGAFRQFLERDGQRHDMYLYGLLREEWQASRNADGHFAIRTA